MAKRLQSKYLLISVLAFFSVLVLEKSRSCHNTPCQPCQSLDKHLNISGDRLFTKPRQAKGSKVKESLPALAHSSQKDFSSNSSSKIVETPQKGAKSKLSEDGLRLSQHSSPSRNVSSGHPPRIQKSTKRPSSEGSVHARKKTAPSAYLSLVPSILYKKDHAYGGGTVNDFAKQRIEHVIREGQGMKAVTTETGETAWQENGVVYRPWSRGKDNDVPYSSEYETYVPFNEHDFFEGRTPSRCYKNNEKKIILWHTPPRYVKRISGLAPLATCPDFPCSITTNATFYLKKSAAVMFAAQILPPSPPEKKPGQVFILHNHEPPYVNLFFRERWRKGFDRLAWEKAFNWTMTYRADSDIVVPYGVVRKRPSPVAGKDYERLVAKKTKMVAWMVSNCDTSSAREKYVKELQKYVQVDVFGNCGPNHCPRGRDDQCGKLISDKYKFYLSFESALCPDYITEKFFRFLTLDIILVARGSDDYFQLAPQEIFLNTANFPSPKKLAERMYYLSNHTSAYIAMLKEKDKYTPMMDAYPIEKNGKKVAFMTYRFESVGLCQVCQRLWNVDKYRKHNTNIHRWMNKKLCLRPKDF